MSVLDDPQIMNRLCVGGLKISQDVPSRKMVIPSKDIVNLVHARLTDSVCDELQTLYYPKSTRDDIRYQVVNMALKDDNRDDIRHLLMYSDPVNTVGRLITRHSIIK